MDACMTLLVVLSQVLCAVQCVMPCYTDMLVLLALLEITQSCKYKCVQQPAHAEGVWAMVDALAAAAVVHAMQTLCESGAAALWIEPTE